MTHYRLDWISNSSKRIVLHGGRAYGKTFFSRLWMQYHYPDLVSQQLIRKLAAEAVVNISINN